MTVRQDGHTVARRRLPWPASPGRVFRIPSAMVNAADPRYGTITVDIN